MTLRTSLVVLLTVSTAWGQQFFVRNGRAVDGSATYKKSIEREIAFVIDDIARACDISEQQKRKLTLAGKGAVAASMEKYEARMKKMRDQMRGRGIAIGNVDPFREADDDKAEADADVAVEAEADAVVEAEVAVAGVAQAIEIVAGNGFNFGMGAAGSNTPVTSEPRWTRALASVLTDPQRSAYKLVLERRKAFVRKSAVANFVARVDHKLLLSEDQRKKLTTLVDEECGQQLARQAAQHIGMNQTIWWGGVGNGRQAQPISHRELQSFLSKPQFEEWTQSYEGQLNMLRGQLGNAAFRFNNIAPAVPVQPAPAVQVEQKKDDK